MFANFEQVVARCRVAHADCRALTTMVTAQAKASMQVAFDFAEHLAWNDEHAYGQLSDDEREALDEFVDMLDLVELDDDQFMEGLQTPEQACERVKLFLDRVDGTSAV